MDNAGIAPAAETEADALLTSAGLERQVELLAAGEITSTDLVEASLARAEALQPKLGAFRVLLPDEARAAAAAADRRLAAGERAPLLGVPVAVKDDVDVAGQTTPFGCAGEFEPARADSEVVRRLRDAGAAIVGKTSTCEIGQWHFSETTAYPAARNPWDPERTPGGSSGGAAAAVAGGIVPAATGSDGAGSVRIPAAWCGLVGVKPQRGRISTLPEPEAFNGLTCFGPITRSVGDAALLLDAVSGNRDGDAHRPPPPAAPFAEAARSDPGPLRIALSFTTTLGASSWIHPEIRTLIERLAARLTDLGHEVFPDDPAYGPVGLCLLPRGSVGLRDWARQVPDPRLLEPRTRVATRIGAAMRGLPLRAARRAEPMVRRRIGHIFERADVVLTPTTAKPPPKIGAHADDGWWKTSNAAGAACPFAWPWNVIGFPALSVPAGRTEAGLPVGAQLVGNECAEPTLLALAAQLESLERWDEHRPALTA